MICLRALSFVFGAGMMRTWDELIWYLFEAKLVWKIEWTVYTTIAIRLFKCLQLHVSSPTHSWKSTILTSTKGCSDTSVISFLRRKLSLIVTRGTWSNGKRHTHLWYGTCPRGKQAYVWNLGEVKPPTTLPCSCVHLRSSFSASLSFFIPHCTLHPHIRTIYTSALIPDLFISRVCGLTVRHPARRHLGLSARVNALRVRLAGRCGFESRHIQFFFFSQFFWTSVKEWKEAHTMHVGFRLYPGLLRLLAISL
jgi:hypothetical protein